MGGREGSLTAQDGVKKRRKIEKKERKEEIGEREERERGTDLQRGRFPIVERRKIEI